MAKISVGKIDKEASASRVIRSLSVPARDPVNADMRIVVIDERDPRCLDQPEMIELVEAAVIELAVHKL